MEMEKNSTLKYGIWLTGASMMFVSAWFCVRLTGTARRFRTAFVRDVLLIAIAVIILYPLLYREDTKQAVELALDGTDLSKGALYFAARNAANEKNMRWFDTHLVRLFAHGGHEFFG